MALQYPDVVPHRRRVSETQSYVSVFPPLLPCLVLTAQLHEMTAQLELEKFDLQKQHTRAIQEILEDTNARLQRMEAEYSSQVDTHVKPSSSFMPFP